MTVQLDGIPELFRGMPRWVVWRREVRDGEPTKVPYDPKNPTARAKSNDPGTWGEFGDAVKVFQGGGWDGPGIELGRLSPNLYLIGCDLDDCYDASTNEITEEWARDVLEAIPTYWEVSPSGTGLKGFMLSREPLPAGRRKKTFGKHKAIEFYDAGRYFAVTGRHYAGSVAECTTEALEAYRTVFPLEPPKDPPAPPPPGLVSGTDDEVLRRVRGSSQAAEFEALWRGEVPASKTHSDADYDLIKKLLYWSGGDQAQADRLFRSSGLMRPKWDERRGDRGTYGTITMEEAAATMSGYWQPAPEVEHVVSIGTGAWPAPIDEAALIGPAGEFVRAVAPHSEADPAALLVQFLVAASNSIGPNPYIRVESTLHRLVLNALVVGETGESRKGTSLRRVKEAMRYADPEWHAECWSKGTLGSGEGLIWRLRDPSEKRRREQQDDGTFVDQPEDMGATDKRFLHAEEEFAAILQVAGRTDNILGVIIRKCFDDPDLENIVKTSPARATGVHFSLIGHTTLEELGHLLREVDVENGLLNRFLIILVRASEQHHPFGGNLPPAWFQEFGLRLRPILDAARTTNEITWGPDAAAAWGGDQRADGSYVGNGIYSDLKKAKPGLLGKATHRAAPYVLRLASLYALLDQTTRIGLQHLDAALAVWDYCEASARYLFGDRTGNPLAETIRDALRAAGSAGLTRTGIRGEVGNNVRADEIEKALEMLKAVHLAERQRVPTGGKPKEVWRSLETTEEDPE